MIVFQAITVHDHGNWQNSTSAGSKNRRNEGSLCRSRFGSRLPAVSVSARMAASFCGNGAGETTIRSYCSVPSNTFADDLRVHRSYNTDEVTR
jgi:hypothetical protein